MTAITLIAHTRLIIGVFDYSFYDIKSFPICKTVGLNLTVFSIVIYNLIYYNKINMQLFSYLLKGDTL